MSRWLSSVGNILEKLDDRVETVVEEQRHLQHRNSINQHGEEEGEEDSGDNIVNILAKRGLSNVDSKDEEDDNDVMDVENQQERVAKEDADDAEQKDDVPPVEQKSEAPDSEPQEDFIKGEQKPSDAVITQSNPDGQDAKEPETLPPDQIVKEGKNVNETILKEKGPPSSINDGAGSSSTTKPKETPAPKLSTPTKKASLSTSARSQVGTPTRTEKERALTLEMKEAQKEARTLRRHVVSLNEQLENAETELQAQRKELDRAAERMEKDRIRQKEEKEATQRRFTQEMTLLKTQQEKTLKEQQLRFEEQLDKYRQKVLEEESRRKQEGGDWTKEMSQAIDREQEMRHKVNALEDENATLLSQISTLEGQQTALGSRLESLTQAADNAMEREREAEDRLDSALNQHARQISQRQAREAELERTVQELNAALVVARNKGLSNGRRSSANADDDSSTSAQVRINALEMDLETASSHLALERERSETLQMQLRELSKETSQEATTVHAKQLQNDRKIAEMSLTISKLQNQLREAESRDMPASESSVRDEDMANQVKMLSEEVVRLRDKLANQNSESVAMKHRLKSAVDRANKLEDELTAAKATPNGGGDLDDSMERGQNSRRRRVAGQNAGSIRSVMRLDSMGDERTQKIAQVVDAVDSFSVSTGKYLRRNPLARAGFIFYLVLIHLWCFVILFFHAHSFEEHGDFGAGVGVPHGPHALMTQRSIVTPPIEAINANAGAAVPNKAPPKRNSIEIADDKKEGEAIGADSVADSNSGKDPDQNAAESNGQ